MSQILMNIYNGKFVNTKERHLEGFCRPILIRKGKDLVHPEKDPKTLRVVYRKVPRELLV